MAPISDNDIKLDLKSSNSGAVYVGAETGRLSRGDVFHPGSSFRLYERRDGTLSGT